MSTKTTFEPTSKSMTIGKTPSETTETEQKKSNDSYTSVEGRTVQNQFKALSKGLSITPDDSGAVGADSMLSTTYSPMDDLGGLAPIFGDNLEAVNEGAFDNISVNTSPVARTLEPIGNNAYAEKLNPVELPTSARELSFNSDLSDEATSRDKLSYYRNFLDYYQAMKNNILESLQGGQLSYEDSLLAKQKLTKLDRAIQYTNEQMELIPCKA